MTSHSDEIVDTFRARALEHGDIVIESVPARRGGFTTLAYAVLDQQRVNLDLDVAIAHVTQRTKEEPCS